MVFLGPPGDLARPRAGRRRRRYVEPEQPPFAAGGHFHTDTTISAAEGKRGDIRIVRCLGAHRHGVPPVPYQDARLPWLLALTPALQAVPRPRNARRIG